MNTWRRHFSTSPTSSLPSLKRLLSPFLFHCHPDQSPKDIPVIRTVNLNAVQTLFQMVDAVESNTNSNSTGPYKFDIEFMVRTTDETNKKTKKKKQEQIWTRRSVELILSRKLLSMDRSSDQTAQQKLHHQAQEQIVKLLRVAGLHASAQNVQDQITNVQQDDDEEDEFLRNEFGLGTPRGVSSTPISRYDQSRRRFVKNFDHAKHHQLYRSALRDAEADLATSSKLYAEKKHEERKHRFISTILSHLVMDESCDVGEDMLRQQLIALRRMSLLFYDYFEELEMQDFGRLWEEITIILLPQRENNKRKGESGFKFSLDSNHKITAHVPIDFLDEELVREFKAYLHQVWTMQVQDGIEDFYPSYWRNAM